MKKIIIIFCILISINTTAFANNSIYDENNYLVSYSAPYNGTERFNLPTVSKSIALNIAWNFILNNCPEIVNEINMDKATITYNKSYPYGYNIILPRIIAGIEYSGNYISLFVDSNSGDVINFTKNFINNITVENYSSIIDTKTAEDKYKLSLGLNLQYNKNISDGKIKTYLTYTAGDIIINAVTGNIISTSYYIPSDGYFDVTYTAEMVSEYVDDGTTLSISEADRIARNINELEITDHYKINSVKYLKNQDDTYLISIMYENASNFKEVTLNAKTGLLTEYADNSANVTGSNYTNTAEQFAEKYYSPYINSAIKRVRNDEQNNILLYERLVNEIPFKSNGLYICYTNGKLKHVSFLWDNVEFESTHDTITSDYAYEKLFDKCGLELNYYKRENNVLTPVYKLSSKGTGIIDAKTGRQLNYDGSIYYSSKEMNYIDINSHYAGNIARKMSDCDIYVSSGHVLLEDYITQQEYLLLISEFIDGTKPVLSTTGVLTDDQTEMLYAYMYDNNVIDRSETDYKSYVTRANAVKYFLRVLGYGTVADMSEIFIRHFKDSDDIPENLIGYVELARSMGLINGSMDNYFKPNEFLTNGDSLIIMYNYLKKQG